MYNGLWNNGKAIFVGSRPLFLEKESLYLLMFEKIKSNNHANNGVSTTFYRPIHSNKNKIMKDIINKHKVLLSLPDNKVKLDNIRAILHYRDRGGGGVGRAAALPLFLRPRPHFLR